MFAEEEYYSSFIREIVRSSRCLEEGVKVIDYFRRFQ